jgi:hypothetical protein
MGGLLLQMPSMAAMQTHEVTFRSFQGVRFGIASFVSDLIVRIDFAWWVSVVEDDGTIVSSLQGCFVATMRRAYALGGRPGDAALLNEGC